MSQERESVEGSFDSILARRVSKASRSSSVQAASAGSSGMLTGSVALHHQYHVPGSINTSTPCAACKLLRRRCAQECPFAPYFSPHEPQRFASVHKIYGASNVSKMLMEVPEMQRADAANSLVYEANARIRDPVYGCMGVVSTLQQQAQTLQAELNAVRGEVLRYRACHEAAMQQQAQPAYNTTADHLQRAGHPTATIAPADNYIHANIPTSIPSGGSSAGGGGAQDTKDRLISWP